MTNKERADKALTAIKTFSFQTGLDPNNAGDLPALVSDLLADIRHYCQQNKISFTECYDTAMRNFRQEMIEERQ